MNIKKLNEELKSILNEEISDNFLLTDLSYIIKYGEKTFKKYVPKVDTLNYKLIDLGLAQIADIVVTAAEVNGLTLDTADSTYIEYDPTNGIIKSKEPIALFNGESQRATISFEMTLWTHPDSINII